LAPAAHDRILRGIRHVMCCMLRNDTSLSIAVAAQFLDWLAHNFRLQTSI
jgi:hypothetical protein